MKKALRTACFASLTLIWLAGCTSSPETPEISSLLGKAAVFSTEATIVRANPSTRELTLEVPSKPGDNFFDVYVGKEFGDLSKVRSGDRLRVSYVEAVFIDRLQSSDVDPGIGFVDAVGTAPPHERPASGVAQGIFVVATIEGIDLENGFVALEGPKGIDKVLKVRNPAVLANIQIGDRVKTTFTRALVLDISPSPSRQGKAKSSS